MKQINRLDILDMAKRFSTEHKKVTPSQILSRVRRSKHLVPPPIPGSKPLAWDADVVFAWEKGTRYFYGETWGLEDVKSKPSQKTKQTGDSLLNLKEHL